jgi:hypothetical protein
MQFPLFLPRKASRDVPAARSSNKARPPYVREVKPRRCLRARILDLLPVLYVRRCTRFNAAAQREDDHGDLDTLFAVWGSLRASARRSVDLSLVAKRRFLRAFAGLPSRAIDPRGRYPCAQGRSEANGVLYVLAAFCFLFRETTTRDAKRVSSSRQRALAAEFGEERNVARVARYDPVQSERDPNYTALRISRGTLLSSPLLSRRLSRLVG